MFTLNQKVTFKGRPATVGYVRGNGDVVLMMLDTHRIKTVKAAQVTK